MSTADSSRWNLSAITRAKLCLLVLLWLPLSLRAQEMPSEFFWPTNWPPRVHDPSTIVHDGTNFWIYSTGWNLLARRSADLTNWVPAGHVFDSLPNSLTSLRYKNRISLWAPDLIRVGDRWLLFYSYSQFGSNTSVIALATNRTLDPASPAYRWQDEGIVVQSVKSNKFNCIDPAAFSDDDGKLWLTFGSYWSGIKLVELDPATGKRVSTNAPIHSLAWNKAIEASGLVKHDGEYFLFVNWGTCCQGTNSTYEIRVGRSRNVTGPYRGQLGQDLLHGGGSPFLAREGRFFGPGHASVLREGTNEYVSFHFYDATRRGAPMLGIRRLGWDTNGWPVAQEWISQAELNP